MENKCTNENIGTLSGCSIETPTLKFSATPSDNSLSNPTELTMSEIVKQSSALNHLPQLIDAIIQNSSTPLAKTNFPLLDEILNGGLFPGVYVLGAEPSHGKTAFALLIANELARNGFHSIFFSLEMGRNMLEARSISRLTYLDAPDYPYGNQHRESAKTAADILYGRKWKNNSTEENELIISSFSKYGTYANNLHFFEEKMCSTPGNPVTVADIRKYIEGCIEVIASQCNTYNEKNTNKNFVVFIDYLQVIGSTYTYLKEHERIKKIVHELKAISNDLQIPIIAISSLNRQSYNQGPHMNSFSGSGSIEYGADVLLLMSDLPLEKTTTENKKTLPTNKMKSSSKTTSSCNSPRMIELFIMKNRDGIARRRLKFAFWPHVNHFAEIGEIKDEQ